MYVFSRSGEAAFADFLPRRRSSMQPAARKNHSQKNDFQVCSITPSLTLTPSSTFDGDGDGNESLELRGHRVDARDNSIA
jgi:hypothetical protein